ncbi:MAG: class I SAM-dependent methyltransferase [Desulfuromusa sp.]|nr:class I SAM-dependent methyltransferase [Desulfuromusa sp.]
MIQQNSYLMEHEEESLRLEMKTDIEEVKRQAQWAGIRSGMSVLDVGCGSGITTRALAELVGPKGHATGLDISSKRIEYAASHHQLPNNTFVVHDIRRPYLQDKAFDAVWSRFFIEYFRADQFSIVKNILTPLSPGGVACLSDLDNNSIGHFGMSDRLKTSLTNIMDILERDFDFDPYAGRKIFGYLFDLGFLDIDCNVKTHHLLFGELSEKDRYNWERKIDVAVKKTGYDFDEYGGDYYLFRKEVLAFLESPRRFTYTPLIMVRGIKKG